ncbi:sensor histidine kinase [Rhizorhabdus sp. FW153]|uniref:sensor histidine kinase n=1 Tax=Rhizorhabdus sp. FW153 TaxID=3400216 RepID=UPI003CFB6E85
MTFNAETPRGATVSPRVALISIICFWMVYCVIATIRSFMIDLGHQTDMLAARAFVSIGSMVATYIVYLAMRPLARKSLAVNVTAVALLSIPAAVAYSSMNWMAFREIDRRIEADKASTVSKSVVDTDSAAQARAQAKAAVEAARAAIKEAAEQAREAAQEKAEAQREAAEHQAEIQRELAEAQNELARANAERRRQADEGKREAEAALREAARAQQEAYKEAVRDYREQMKGARLAVEEARRNGIKIDLDSILSAAPPPPPAPPAMPAEAAPATAPDLSDTQPSFPKIEIPKPVEIPMPVVSEPSPGTVMIQVGRPADIYKEHDKSVLAQIADQALNGYFFFAAWGALFLALSYAAAVRDAERQAASYRAAARDAELRALRYQVNPHFLFNTLNSLSTLILKDSRDEAEKMILNLSTFFRTSLTADPTEDVVLAEEIRLQRLYLDIEAIRFPDRLLVEIHVPPALEDVRVPCLILQPLVENAIKYGVSRSRRPVTLRITAREDSHGLVLSVEDDGDPLAEGEAPAGTGVGLRNVSDRLRARFGEEASCRFGPLPNGGFGVTLFMPLIRNDS